MWTCRKCSKPVFFAERMQSLGFSYHPECLRCEECGKRLQPGQHSDHKSLPYCNVPCYAARYGPQLFGHGTRVESHTNFGQKDQKEPVVSPKILSPGPQLPRAHLESKLKVYNQFFGNKNLEIRSKEVEGRLHMEGPLRIYWGIQGVIHLKEDDDQRTVVTIRKRNSVRYPNSVDIIKERMELTQLSNLEDLSIEDKENTITDNNDTTISESLSYDVMSASMSTDTQSIGSAESSKENSPAHLSATLPSKIDVKKIDWDEIDELLQVEKTNEEIGQIYQTMPMQRSINSISSFTEISSPTTDDTTSYKTLTPGIEEETTSESQTIYYSPLNSSSLENPNEEDTPTLKPQDYEDFKKQMSEDFITGTNEMRNVDENTLKFKQSIDPSRINDSLKLYSENIMNKSMNDDSFSMYSLSNSGFIPGQINSINITDTLNLLKKSSSSSSDDRTLRHESNLKAKPAHYLKKSISMGTTSSSNDTPEDDSWGADRGLLRSKSDQNYAHKNGDDYSSDTVKYSGKSSISIRMDCYGELSKNNENGVAEVFSESSSSTSTPTSTNDKFDGKEGSMFINEDGVVLRKRPKGSTAIKRRSGNRRSRTKLKRRCSINGHFYNRETSHFTPPRGSQMSVWVSSMVSTQEVINLVMEKYKVESKAENFGLYIIRDNGEQKKLREDDFPLISRIMLGPHEDVSKLFLMDAQETAEISPEVAQFLNLSIPECRSIMNRYSEEEERELSRIHEKYSEFRKRIIQRMESLKVRL